MFTLDEIIRATDAELIGETIKGSFTISTDTRTIKQGEIYLPLKGENFDGENFIDKALQNGAAVSFCTREPSEITHPFLKVDDALQAYLKLAKFYKDKISPKTVAITGSSGKTTTKEIAYSVINEKFKTIKTEKNNNNEIGLCKTILSMPEDTQVLILEMGMRGLGEIELLARYSQPDIAIIANVGTAHIGRLGSRENIAKAKCEISQHIKQGGVLIAHDDIYIKNQLSNCDIDVTYFSLDEVEILEKSIGFTKFIYKNHEYELNVEGEHNVQNALAIIETGLKLGMTETEIAEGLKKYIPIEKRWDVKEIKGYKIINDSYNANPESMKAVIKTVFDNYENPVLILGDMGELGEDEIVYHKQIGDYILKCKNSNAKILTVGVLANEITKILNVENVFSLNFENNEKISKYVLDNVDIGNTIVLKASRFMRFEEIIDNINNNMKG